MRTNTEIPSLAEGVESVYKQINKVRYSGLALAAVALSAWGGLVETIQSVIDKQDTASDIGTVLLSSLFTLSSMGLAHRREFRKSSISFQNKREFSDSVFFEEVYEFIDKEDGNKHTVPAPLTVHVTGNGQEDLGIGEIIGSVILDDDIKNITIIEIEDPKSISGTVQLTDTECRFTLLEEEELERRQEIYATTPAYSAHKYASLLDRRLLGN